MIPLLILHLAPCSHPEIHSADENCGQVTRSPSPAPPSSPTCQAGSGMPKDVRDGLPHASAGMSLGKESGKRMQEFKRR